jgi:hypothetical protein
MVTKDVQCVGQTQLVVIQKDLETLPMSIAIGGCDKTTHIKPMFVITMGSLEEVRPHLSC